MQFFGEKYGDWVRVVQIGGRATALDGYSMELCGGTHTSRHRRDGSVPHRGRIRHCLRHPPHRGGFRPGSVPPEQQQTFTCQELAGKVSSPVGELEKKIESLLAHQKELEKQLRAFQQKQAGDLARNLAAKARTVGSVPAVIEDLGAGDGDYLQSVADALKGQFKGVVVLGGAANGAVTLVATVSPEYTKTFQAGKIIQAIAPVVGGKGGGRPDNARGGGREAGKIGEALAQARELIQAKG